MEVLKISELNKKIKNIITTNLGNIIGVIGEISNIRISGKHTYLTLKDETGIMSVVFWNTKLKQTNGSCVQVNGKLDFYSKTNNLNIVANSITNIGNGILHTQYEQLFETYKNMGYFDNKKELPSKINNIGIVTSIDGAALRDIIYVLNSKKFNGNIYVYNCQVQGIKCASSISKGIDFFNSAFNQNAVTYVSEFTKKTNCTQIDQNDVINVDVILITRGGGSFEDLMGFSSQEVINSLHNSKTYTISAVGHEIDYMLSDYVANYRAPTPSIAGEVIATVNRQDISKLNNIEFNLSILRENIIKTINTYGDELNCIMEQVMLEKISEKILKLEEHVKSYLFNSLNKMETELLHCINLLECVDMQKQMANGCVFILDNAMNILSTEKDIFANKNVKLVCSSGIIDVNIKKIEKLKESHKLK